jgi:peptide/nickel transport system substrate-binding protein
MLPLTSAGPRVAALIAGDVDLVENPPLQDLDRLNADSSLRVVQGISNRVIYIHLDHEQVPSPMIRNTDGKNPLQDVRVREALSIAINRDAIVGRIMGGVAVAAGELLPPGMFGAHEEGDLPPNAFDAERAKALLAEAGYPNGFGITLGTPNDRYINDAQVAQAVAQMWTQIGVETRYRRLDGLHVLLAPQCAGILGLSGRVGRWHGRDVITAESAACDIGQGSRLWGHQCGPLFQPGHG